MELKREEFITNLFSKFLEGSIIYSSTDLIPPHVSLGKKSFINRSSSSQSRKNRSQRTQLIIHPSPLRNIPGLKRNLQATTPHTKRHSIHMYKIVRRRSITNVI